MLKVYKVNLWFHYSKSFYPKQNRIWAGAYILSSYASNNANLVFARRHNNPIRGLEREAELITAFHSENTNKQT